MNEIAKLNRRLLSQKNMTRSTSSFLSAVIALLLIETAFAQQLSEAEKHLLPIAIAESVRGAFGSEFITELTIFNASASTVFVEGVEYPNCQFVGCGLPTLGAGNTLYTRPGSYQNGVGILRFAPASAADSIIVQLRVHDVSRRLSTWGTEIPVIRERDTFKGPIHLLDVPADGNFRTMLRIYDLAPSESHSVNVKISDVTAAGREDPYATGQLIHERTISLPTQRNQFGYAMLAIDPVIGLRPGRRLRVSIVPNISDMKLWAFVSVTHNETQHITVITPQK